MHIDEKYTTCSIKDATLLLVGETTFIKGDTFTYDQKSRTVSVRFEFDRWGEIHVNDFEILSVIPIKEKPVEPFVFRAKLENNGRHFLVVVPNDVSSVFLDKEVEVSINL